MVKLYRYRLDETINIFFQILQIINLKGKGRKRRTFEHVFQIDYKPKYSLKGSRYILYFSIQLVLLFNLHPYW